jgi:hypothetical protein
MNEFAVLAHTYVYRAVAFDEIIHQMAVEYRVLNGRWTTQDRALTLIRFLWY